MTHDAEMLQKIFNKTDGKCHICHKGICLKNHGVNGARGAWHVDHSVPRSKGGADHLNNYLPAHIRCNLARSNKRNRTARQRFGKTRAPLSAVRKNQLRKRNALIAAAIGTLAFAGTGPIGWLLGTSISALVGHSLQPES